MTDEKRKVVPLRAECIKLASDVNARCHVTVPHGTLPEDVLAPEFWRHAMRTPYIVLQPRNHLEVWAEDMTWYAEYLVMSVADNMVRLHGPINYQRLVLEKGKGDVPGFKSRWVPGGGTKWRVVRVADNATIREKFETQQESQDWQWANLSPQAAAA